MGLSLEESFDTKQNLVRVANPSNDSRNYIDSDEEEEKDGARDQDGKEHHVWLNKEVRDEGKGQ